MRFPTRALAAILLLAPALPAAGDVPLMLLDDFDLDPTGERLGNIFLASATDGPADSRLPFLDQDEDYQTLDDVGAVRFDDDDPRNNSLVVGGWPNGQPLLFDLPAEGVIGFRAVFGARSTLGDFDSWPFGLILTDGGATSPERRGAQFDALLPFGDDRFVLDMYLDDPAFFTESGFEPFDVRGITFGFNPSNTINFPNSTRSTLAVEFLEFNAILVPEPAAAGAVVLAGGLLARRRGR